MKNRHRVNSTVPGWLADLKTVILENLDRNNFAAIQKLARIGISFQEMEGKGSDGAWSCQTCGRRLRSRAALREHVKYKHGELQTIKRQQRGRAGSFSCSLCSKRFTTQKGLAAHMRKDRGPHSNPKA